MFYFFFFYGYNKKIFNFFYMKFIFYIFLIFIISLMFFFFNFKMLTFNFMDLFLVFFLKEKYFYVCLSIIFLSIMIFSIYYVNVKMNFFYNMFMLLFCFSMICLIFHKSMITFIMGWDGLGVTSFFLVFFYMNWTALNSSFVTVLTNRLGDALLFIFLPFLIFTSGMNSFFFKSLFVLILFFGLITKSAQFPFSSWLPQAMAAPTPTSSLVHSSTLVTAGIYIFIKYYMFFSLKSIENLFFLFGGFTFFISGMCSIFEKDMKKVIALSTLNQLGFMVLILSTGSMMMTFFHLLSHAFFKSCLFLQSGFFIHSNFSNQDSRGFNFIFNLNYNSFLFFLLCLMSMCGYTFLSGFITKELVLFMFVYGNFYFVFILFIFLLVFFTLLYSSILLFNCLKSSKFYFFKDYTKMMNFCSLFLLFLGIIFSYWFTKSNLLFSFIIGGKEMMFFFFYMFTLFIFFFFLFNFFFVNMVFQDNLYKNFNKLKYKPSYLFDKVLFFFTGILINFFFYLFMFTKNSKYFILFFYFFLLMILIL